MKDDALSYLPSSRVLHFPKCASIYDPSCGPDRVYLILSGRVRVDRISNDGGPTLLHIVEAEDFFGANALIPTSAVLPEVATTMEATQLMAWSYEELQTLIEAKPQLGIALCDYFARQNASLRERIVVMSEFHTDVRVRIALVQLASLLGSPRTDGARRVSKLSHHTIAAYVGTSREIVTGEMNRLRRLGYIDYTRLHTDVYVAALLDWMRQQGNSYWSRLADGGSSEAATAVGRS
jgi:CRP-like cAMP-binding protein